MRQKRFVQYIVPDISPEKYPKHMKYYIHFPGDSEDIFYLENNHGEEYTIKELEEKVKAGELIKLPKRIELPSISSLFLTSDNKIIMALGHNCEKGQKEVYSFYNE